MIVVTGALGFIGSAFVSYLNRLGHSNILVVDDFYQWRKEKNLNGKRVREWIHRDLFINYFEKSSSQVDVVFHLGARTDTVSADTDLFDALNLKYSQAIWTMCAEHQIPLIYASSAATYGDGSQGFSDDHSGIASLQPLNAYAWSKHNFDLWALEQTRTPPHWYGLKFFNVFGPNEYHKGRMASVVYHAWHQIRESGQLKLFKSHHPDYADGAQRRDFIYVLDVLGMMWDIHSQKPVSGIYNVGTGKARSFADLGHAVFNAISMPAALNYIDMPDDLREKYQYFTEADMSKWTTAGLRLPAAPLEETIKAYVQGYLKTGLFF